MYISAAHCADFIRKRCLDLLHKLLVRNLQHLLLSILMISTAWALLCYVDYWRNTFVNNSIIRYQGEVRINSEVSVNNIRTNFTSAHTINEHSMELTSSQLGTQMGEAQLKLISNKLPRDGNLLVWGLGNESPFWHNSTTGKVIFIEDAYAKEGMHSHDTITKRYPFLEVYIVHYTTDIVRSYDTYMNNPELWSDLDIRAQLPPSVTNVHWHVIIVDAPLSCCDKGPGRYQSIYTSWLLAKTSTHIFIDDFERMVEHNLSLKLLGKPIEVVSRPTTNQLNANKQAHFIRSSDEDAIFRPIYSDRELQRKVIAQWNNTHSTNISNWTILLSVNNGFWDFLQNWWWHYKQLHINIPVIIIAEDTIVLKKLASLNSNNIVIVRSSLINIAQAVEFNSPLYNEMVSARGEYILTYLKEGINIIYTDVDTVWLQNPIPYFTGAFDVWNQKDNVHNLCTGFMAIKSNAHTIELVKMWSHDLRGNQRPNQHVFNTWIEELFILHKGLDTSKFPSGKEYFKQFTNEQRSNVVVMHNNFITGHDKKE